MRAGPVPGPRAVEIWKKHSDSIDMLLTDMVMPEGMSGRELAMQLRLQKPTLKVIYTSGYSSESLTTDFGSNDTLFLAKPYLPPKLAQLVRQALDAAPARHGELEPA